MAANFVCNCVCLHTDGHSGDCVKVDACKGVKEKSCQFLHLYTFFPGSQRRDTNRPKLSNSVVYLFFMTTPAAKGLTGRAYARIFCVKPDTLPPLLLHSIPLPQAEPGCAPVPVPGRSCRAHRGNTCARNACSRKLRHRCRNCWRAHPEQRSHHIPE